MGALDIYDPVTKAWSTGATMPDAYFSSAVAVLNGKMYVIGGCRYGSCNTTDVQVYDPSSNTWSFAADYPQPVSWEGCGAIGGEIYCAGGTSDSGGATASAYIYNPASNTWSTLPTMPMPMWGMAYAEANGQLLLSGGDSGQTLTHQGFSYTPGGGWTALPDSNLVEANGACGFYEIAGFPDAGISQSPVYQLPGYPDCTGDSDTAVPWLSQTSATTALAPGQSVTVTVTLNAGDRSITQPGAYTAQIIADSNTPYPLSVPVTMNVTPPKTWGEIAGTITAGGKPLAGATVQIGTSGGTGRENYTLTSNAAGQYSLWLDQRYSPLQVIVSMDGYQPQTKTAAITEGKTTILNFALKQG